MGFTAIMFRPVQVRVMDIMNTTASPLLANDTTALNSFMDTINVSNGVYWTIPIMGIIFIALWLYSYSQRKEYVTAGVYG